MENALVGSDLLNLIVDNQLLQSLRGGAGAVQGLVSHNRDRRRLVSQGLGDGEVVDRRRADGPRVAEDVFLLAVEVGEFGRVRLGRQDGKRCLVSCQYTRKERRGSFTYVPGLGRVGAHAEACRVTASDEDQPVLCGGWAGSRVNCQHLLPVLQCDGMLNSGRYC